MGLISYCVPTKVVTLYLFSTEVLKANSSYLLKLFVEKFSNPLIQNYYFLYDVLRHSEHQFIVPFSFH